MKEVYLHGQLGNKYGKDPIDIDAQTAALITKGLICRFGSEFKNIIRTGTFEFVCIKNKAKTYVHDSLTAQMVIDADEIHITPVPKGSGKLGQIILGTILIVVGLVTNVTEITAAGVAMVAGGVVQLLTPVPNFEALSNERPDARPSFLFNGAVNVFEQGGPVPLCYGRFKCGTVIVSAGFSVEQLPFNIVNYPDYVNTPDGPRRPYVRPLL